MLRISQSLIKSYYDYRREELCGILFQAKYIDQSVESEPSDAMKEGIYFEYLCTGSLPKSGKIPEPEVDRNGRLKEAYKRIEKQVELFKKIIAHYKIKIIKAGYALYDDRKSGVIDIYAEFKGQKVFIDTKYSGLLDNKWSEMGWHPERLAENDTLMVQGVHYKILAEDILGIKDIPFYYFVFNSKKENDAKIILQEVDPDKVEKHREVIDTVYGMVQREIKEGFTPYPKYRDCVQCPLFDSCEYAQRVPEIEVVQY